VCAALRAGPGAVVDQAPVLMWAAGYAASSGGRGPQRVGLANATRLADLAPADALGAIRGLGRAAGLATMTAEQAIAAGVDRRAFTNQRRPPAPVRQRRDPGAR
jgi:hypothetical protein